MSFPIKRRSRKERDREYEQQARVRHVDGIADRYASGNVYSPSDIEALEREKLQFWRRRRR